MNSYVKLMYILMSKHTTFFHLKLLNDPVVRFGFSILNFIKDIGHFSRAVNQISFKTV